jgi:hypothetical protein
MRKLRMYLPLLMVAAPLRVCAKPLSASEIRGEILPAVMSSSPIEDSSVDIASLLPPWF